MAPKSKVTASVSPIPAHGHSTRLYSRERRGQCHTSSLFLPLQSADPVLARSFLQPANLTAQDPSVNLSFRTFTLNPRSGGLNTRDSEKGLAVASAVSKLFYGFLDLSSIDHRSSDPRIPRCVLCGSFILLESRPN